MWTIAWHRIGWRIIILASLFLLACGAETTAPLETAPALSFATFDGGRFALDDTRGSIVVLNFWASWCGPCRTEMPAFDTAAHRYHERGVVVVGLATKDNENAAQTFAREIGATYILGFDQGDAIAANYSIYGLPSTLFIDRNGKIARRVPGILSETQLTAYIDELLKP